MNVSTLKKIGAVALVAVVSLTAGDPAGASPSVDTGMSQCSRRSVETRLSSADTDTWTVVGWLCGPRRPRSQTVELLLAGATYDHNYWMTPGYSYVEFATRTGRTTFVVDRLGTGESDKPPAERVTMLAHAYVARQLVSALRSGEVMGSRAARVIGVGHSIGAGVWMMVFGTTTVANAGRDRPDALILQDFMHDVNVPHITAIGQSRYPADQDPRFVNAALPTGYLTTIPGTRHLFYDVRFASPRVIEHDELTKSLTTTGEVSTLAVTRDPTMSRSIDVPTMVILGTHDALYCNETLRCDTETDISDREAGYYTGTRDVEWEVLPLAGHDANSHYDAYVGFTAVARWLSRLR